MHFNFNCHFYIMTFCSTNLITRGNETEDVIYRPHAILPRYIYCDWIGKFLLAPSRGIFFGCLSARKWPSLASLNYLSSCVSDSLNFDDLVNIGRNAESTRECASGGYNFILKNKNHEKNSL